MTDPFEQSMPYCPKCLVPLDVEGPDEMPYLECPTCRAAFWV